MFLRDREARISAATFLVALIACSACAVGTGTEVSAPAATLLPQLNTEPARLPTEPPPDGSVVLLLLGVDGNGRVEPDGPPILRSAADLRLPRAMTRRRTAPPRGWLMLREPGADTIRYWIPLDPERLIRTPVDATEEDGHPRALTRAPTAHTAVLLPHFPRAELEFLRANGSDAGAFRFGDDPREPLERIR